MNLSEEARDRVRRLLSEPPPPPAPSPAPGGRRIGKYTILREIGRGGMGSVYEAEDPVLHRRVALKVLKEVAEGSLIVERLHREATIVAQLRHPNIVVIHEVATVNESDGRLLHFIAMEYVEGTTLADEIAAKVTSQKALVAMLEVVARAVAFAHSKGVVHRDLKPANVLVEKGGRLALTDFGLARADAFESKLTKSHSVIGTPLYMAPEQVAGRTRDIDARTDVYALGVMLYEIMTGHPPFAAPTPAELYHQIATEEPTRPSVHGRTIDRDLEVIAMKALSKERARRFPTATAFADDLARWLRGERISARPPSVMYRVRQSLSRRRATLVVVLLLIAGAAGYVPLWRALARRNDDEQQRQKRDSEAQTLRDAELAATRELGALWSDVLVAKQGLHNSTAEPAQVRADFASVIARLSQHTDRFRARPQGWYVRARARLLLNELDEAERDLRQSLALDATFAPAEALLARVVLERFEAAIFGDPDFAEQHIAAAQPLLREAQAHVERGRTSGVERLSVEKWGLPRTPDDEATEVLLLAMLALHADGDRSRALRLLEEADQRFPCAEYARWRGVWTQDGVVAIRHLTIALTRMPHYAGALMDFAWRDLQDSRFDDAVDHYTRAIAINPKLVRAHGSRAAARLFKGDFEGAIVDCDAALLLDAVDTSSYVNRGWAKLNVRDLAGAEADYAKAIDLAPGLAKAWSGRGTVRTALEDLDGSLKDYTRAIELAPKLQSARENRGTLHLRRGEYEAAIEDLTVAIEGNPRSANALYRRAAARSQLWPQQGRDRATLVLIKLDLDKAFEVAAEKWVARPAAEDLRTWLRGQLGEE